MAAFCMKCGAALAEGATSCSACGAPAGASAATPAAAPVTAAPAGKKGPNVVMIVLIIVGVLVVIGGVVIVSGLWFASRVVSNVEVDGSGEAVRVRTPGGTISVGGAAAVSEDDLGVPLYPGAEHKPEGSWTMETAEGRVGIYVFNTNDRPAEVIAFYREKLGDRITSVFESAEGAVISVDVKDNSGTVITVGTAEGKTSITINRTRGKPQTQ
jgi:hypothetical protein